MSTDPLRAFVEEMASVCLYPGAGNASCREINRTPDPSSLGENLWCYACRARAALESAREADPPLPADPGEPVTITCELCGHDDYSLWLLPKGKACITCYGAHHRDVEHARIVARIQEMGRNYDVYNDVASVIEAEGPGGKTP